MSCKRQIGSSGLHAQFRRLSANSTVVHLTGRNAADYLFTDVNNVPLVSPIGLKSWSYSSHGLHDFVFIFFIIYFMFLHCFGWICSPLPITNDTYVRLHSPPPAPVARFALLFVWLDFWTQYFIECHQRNEPFLTFNISISAWMMENWLVLQDKR